MAKDTKDKSLSWEDFQQDDNLLDNDIEDNDDDNDEVVDVQEEEEQEEEVKPKKEVKKKKVEKVEEEESEEENSEDEKQESTKKPEKKKVEEVKNETKEKEETSEEKEEEDEASEEKFATTFITQLQELTGNEVDLDYGETSPVSVEGLALREKAVKEQALANFLQEIEENFPKIYKALEYANNGGDPADLFRQATSRDYSKVTLGDSDQALAREVLKEFYSSKKFSEAKIAKLIEQDEDSEGGIIGEAKIALSELQKEQEDRSQELLRSKETEAAEIRKKAQVFHAKVDEVLETRTLGNFKIGDKVELNEFRKFFLNKLQRVGDTYVALTPVDATNLENVLQYEYFQFKKGDLSKMIQRKAATENANKLKLRMRTEQEKQKKGSVDQKRTSLTLKDFTEN